MAKQEAEKIKSEKQDEIEKLKAKLADMETKSQLMASEHRLAYLDGMHSMDKWEAKSFLESTFEKEAEGARKDRLKQKFRERQKNNSFSQR